MIKEMTFDYIVDEKNRVVICQGIVPVECEDCDDVCWAVFDKAVARCHEGDEFDVEFGKKLAQRKLLLKVNKAQRKFMDKKVAEARAYLQHCLDEYDKLNNELARHCNKIREIKLSKYPEEA